MTTGGRRVADEWYAEEVLVVAPPPGVRLLPMARRPAIRDEEIREEEEDVAAIAAIASVVMQNGVLVLLITYAVDWFTNWYVCHHGDGVCLAAPWFWFLQACWELLSDVIDESLCTCTCKCTAVLSIENRTRKC